VIISSSSCTASVGQLTSTLEVISETCSGELESIGSTVLGFSSTDLFDFFLGFFFLLPLKQSCSSVADGFAVLLSRFSRTSFSTKELSTFKTFSKTISGSLTVVPPISPHCFALSTAIVIEVGSSGDFDTILGAL